MTISPAQALLEIGGWEDAVVEHLPGGSSNCTWLVTSGERRAVLKIDSEPRQRPFNTRSAEQQVQQQAARAGCANEVLFASDTTYLTEYVDGTVWTAADLAQSDKLMQLADLLRRLHALPLTGRAADAPSAAARYGQAIGNDRADVAKHCLELIQNTPTTDDLHFCHNDLVAENMIATPALLLLDWEYACDNDPLFDLATVVAHHDLSPEQSTLLLDTYFNGDSMRWRERLGEQVRLYNALTWLWYVSQKDTDRGQLAIYESRLA